MNFLQKFKELWLVHFRHTHGWILFGLFWQREYKRGGTNKENIEQIWPSLSWSLERLTLTNYCKEKPASAGEEKKSPQSQCYISKCFHHFVPLVSVCFCEWGSLKKKKKKNDSNCTAAERVEGLQDQYHLTISVNQTSTQKPSGFNYGFKTLWHASISLALNFVFNLNFI